MKEALEAYRAGMEAALWQVAVMADATKANGTTIGVLSWSLTAAKDYDMSEGLIKALGDGLVAAIEAVDAAVA